MHTTPLPRVLREAREPAETPETAKPARLSFARTVTQRVGRMLSGLRPRYRVEPFTGPASLEPRRPGERRVFMHHRVIVYEPSPPKDPD